MMMLYEPLSPRELEVVELVAQGLRNHQIAIRLGVQDGTIKTYLHRIFQKAGVDTRTELAAKWIKAKLDDPSPA